jgi:hypothetical protein
MNAIPLSLISQGFVVLKGPMIGGNHQPDTIIAFSPLGSAFTVG